MVAMESNALQESAGWSLRAHRWKLPQELDAERDFSERPKAQAMEKTDGMLTGRAGVLLALVVLACHLTVGAALSAPPAVEAPAGHEHTPTKAKREAISIPDIPDQASELEIRLKAIQKEMAEQLIAKDAQEAVETEFRKTVGRLQARDQSLLYGPYTARDLMLLRWGWRNLGERLAILDARLGRKADRVQSWLAEIKEQIEIWELTQDAAAKAKAPSLVLTEVANMLQRLSSTERSLEAGRNKIVDLSGKIVSCQRSVQSGLGHIEEARGNLVSEFLRPQDPPLWSVHSPSSNIAQEVGTSSWSLNDLRGESWDYLARHYGRVLLQLLAVVILALAIKRLRLSRDSKSAPDRVESGRGQEDSPPDLMAHPWHIALLIGLTVTPILQPTAPGAPMFLLLVLWVYVWLHLLKLLLPAERLSPLYACSILALMFFARELFWGFRLAYRLFLLMELALGLLGALWLRRSQWLENIPSLGKDTLWFRFLKLWQNLAILAFTGGCVGVLLGYIRLGDAIVAIFVEGTVVGMAFLLYVRIGETLFTQTVEAASIRLLNMELEQRKHLEKLIRSTLHRCGFLVWFYYVLANVALASPLIDAFSGILSAKWGYGRVMFSVGDLIAFGLTLWIAWIFGRLVSYSLYQGVFSRLQMGQGVPYALSSFIRYAIVTCGFLAGITNLGLSLDRIILMLSALGVGIGFGLQSIVKDMVSGTLLLFERPVRVGDWMEVEDLLGVVTRIGIRTSTVRTRDGAEVVVPNGDLVSARLTNWTLSDRKHRVHVKVGVAYGTDPEEVLHILMKVAQAHPDVVDTPSPRALFKGFGDSSLDFELRVWTQDTLRGWQAALQSDLFIKINEALVQHGIDVPFPQRDLHVRSVTPQWNEIITENDFELGGDCAATDRTRTPSESRKPEERLGRSSKAKDDA